MSRAFALSLCALTVLLLRCDAQTCVGPPVELTWTQAPDNTNVFMEAAWEGETSFVVATTEVSALNVKFTSRLFDGLLPAKTLRFKRGNEYRLTVHNNMGPETAANPTADNVQKDPNTMNIHTHGPHISGMSPGDTVFVDIAPQDHHTYVYNVPCDHAGGTFWWHPHHHGSTDAHVAAGAAGFVIIDDDQNMEGLPDWYANMPEQLLMFQQINLTRLETIYSADVDTVFSVETIDGSPASSLTGAQKQFYLINGVHLPNICLNSTEWTRLRIANVDPSFPGIFYIDGDGCKVKQLSRDGVLIHGLNNEVPRDVDIYTNLMWFSEASRSDLAFWCPGDASGSKSYRVMNAFPLTSCFGQCPNAATDLQVATIIVSGSQTSEPAALSTFNPIRPPYLVNMMNSVSPRVAKVEMSDFDINGIRYQSETAYFFEADIGEVIIFDITDLFHTLHVHVNHMQVKSNDNNAPEIWQQPGDYVDSFLSRGEAYYLGDTFGGTVVLHCHILKHEDEGVFTTLLLKGGCGADIISDNDGSFGVPCASVADYSQCVGAVDPYAYYNYNPWYYWYYYYNPWYYYYYGGWSGYWGGYWGGWWANTEQDNYDAVFGAPASFNNGGSGHNSLVDAQFAAGCAIGILVGALAVVACVCGAQRRKGQGRGQAQFAAMAGAMGGASTVGVVDREDRASQQQI